MSKFLRHLKYLLSVFSFRIYVPSKLRFFILRNICGYDIGNCCIMHNSEFKIKTLSIGDYSYINRECLINDGGHNGTVKIGNHVFIGPRVHIDAVSHNIGDSHHRAGSAYTLPITICDGCWIGANTVILPGVTIAEGCVIGACSCVINDTEPNCVYAGVPARKIRVLD